MKTKKRIFVLFIIFVFSCSGCSQADVVQESTTEVFEQKEERTDEMDLVLKEDFIAYYGMSEADASQYDIDGFIEENCIQKDELDSARWDVMLKNDAENGVVYGTNVEKFIHYGYRTATAEDDFAKAEYIIYEVDTILDENQMTRNTVVVDMKKQIIYYDCVLTDIRTATETKEVTEGELSQIVSLLNDMELESWEQPLGAPGDGNEYYWDLNIVMNKKDDIRYSGNIPGTRNVREEKFKDLKAYVDGLK